VHTGVITSQSSGAGNWKYVPPSWNSNNATHSLASIGNNRYSFTINGICDFYKVPAGEAIREIASVYRSDNLQVNVYPNPMGSAIIIHYTVSETSAVSFRLMDLNGRVLQETRAGTKAPGQYLQS